MRSVAIQPFDKPEMARRLEKSRYLKSNDIWLAFKKLKNPKYISEDGYIVCDSCHYITDDPDIDDCNYSRLSCERNSNIERKKYTKENILAFVNEHCNADFDEIVVLDDLAGYRVFADGKRDTPEMYNFGDVFQYDEELTHKRRKKS